MLDQCVLCPHWRFHTFPCVAVSLSCAAVLCWHTVQPCLQARRASVMGLCPGPRTAQMAEGELHPPLQLGLNGQPLPVLSVVMPYGISSRRKIKLVLEKNQYFLWFPQGLDIESLGESGYVSLLICYPNGFSRACTLLKLPKFLLVLNL